MVINIGEIVEGTVAKITEYGAFISLPDGKRGLVHISEVADKYVKNISEHLKERQAVKVKVLNISGDGRKIDLSIKQAQAKDSNANVERHEKHEKPEKRFDSSRIHELHSVVKFKKEVFPGDSVNQSFEEKLAKFLKSSEERQTDLRRNIEAKRGGNKFIR
jgi:S1 RNA binding domain protein